MGKEGADMMRGKRPPLVYEGGVCKAPLGALGRLQWCALLLPQPRLLQAAG